MVTGACGQIGSALVRELVSCGARVVAVDLRPSPSAMSYILAKNVVEGVISYHDFDPSPDSLMWKMFDRCDGVFHFGAKSATNITMDEAQQNFESSHLMYLRAKERSKPFVYASSAAVYGNYGDGKGPLSPYGFTKLSFDRFVQLDAPQSFVTGLRFFNVYGGHESHKGEMRSMVRRLWDIARAGAYDYHPLSVPLFEGSRSFFRDFVHVDDAVRVSHDFMVSHLAGKSYPYSTVGWIISDTEYSRIADVATGKLSTFYDVVDTFNEVYDETFVCSRPVVPYEVRFPEENLHTYTYEAKKCPVSLAKVSLHEGIRRSIDFYHRG